MGYRLRMKKKLINSALFLCTALTAIHSYASPYCAAIRGNGELVPAHWGALAKIVEHKGLPERMAGGSSATISMMFLDAISRNTQLSSDEDLKKLEESLLLKTVMAHLEYLWQEDSKAPKIMGLIQSIKSEKFLGKLKNAIKLATNAQDFVHLLGDYGAILNPALIQELHRDFSFGKTQLIEAITKIGKFDARNDMALFYREGLVDFKFIALMLGKVADYYAGFGEVSANAYQKSFLNNCAVIAKNKWWDELIEEAPYCADLFKKSLNKYYSQKDHANKMIFEKIGSGLSAMPATSIVKGPAIARYFSLRKKYQEQRGNNLQDFSVNYDTELSYGYWGENNLLTRVKQNLTNQFPDDLKSQKFMSLGAGSWFEVLSTSPAEPGLSNLLRLPDSEKMSRNAILSKDYFKKLLGFIPTHRATQWFDEVNPQNGLIPFRKDLLSAGGWSDLHPTLVLKASGCQEVVYVTRQGGDSVFAQQIFIRLSGDTQNLPFWKDIRDNNRKGWTDLSAAGENTPWNRLYNLGNAESSYSRSIKAADAIYCTDWDAYDLFSGQISELQKDAWQAPIFFNQEIDQRNYEFAGTSEGKSQDGFPGCIPKF